MTSKVIVDLDWSRSTFKPGAQNALGKLAQKNIFDFFEFFPGHFCLKVVALSAQPGKARRNLIVLDPTEAKRLSQQKACSGVVVQIYTEGTQSLSAIIASPDFDKETLLSVIKEGPYNKKLRQEKKLLDVVGTVTSPIGTSNQDDEANASSERGLVEEVVGNATATASTAEEEKLATVNLPADVSLASKRRSPLEILRANGNSEEEIERIKGTLAHLVYHHTTEEERTGSGATVQLAVSSITRAIMEHAKLPPNPKGTYQGTIGNFYATKFSLFAYKGYEDDVSPGESYAPWIVDIVLVLDFVGGNDNLAALSRERAREVKELEERRRLAPSPVSALVVEQAVDQEELPEEEIIKMAQAALIAQQGAQEALRAAENNRDQALSELSRLQALVDQAQKTVSVANDLVIEAQKNLKSYSLSKEIGERINQMLENKMRALQDLQSLARNLGL